jgi:8-oxo-dGTP pyrophosphatase MutT (NUDIX family)
MNIDPRLSEIDDCLYRLAVRALIFNEGRVLLVREKDVDWWSFPGGGVDYDEELYQALPRELSEELGVSLADMTTDYKIVYATAGAVVNGIPRVNLFYRVDIPIERIRAGNDVLEYGWFYPNEITSEISVRYVGTSANDGLQFINVIEKLIAVI